MKQTFGQKVKKLMAQSNISQKELSRLTGISESSISRYLNDTLKPRIDVISNIARVFGVSVAQLFEGDSIERKNDYYNETISVVARNRTKLNEKQKAEIIKILFGGD